MSVPYDIKVTLRTALLGKIEEADKGAAACEGWFSQFWADKAKDYRAAMCWLDTVPADWSERSKGIVQDSAVPA